MLKTYTINLGRFGEYDSTEIKELVLKITETESPYVYKMNLISKEGTLNQKFTLVPEEHSSTAQTVRFGEGLI